MAGHSYVIAQVYECEGTFVKHVQMVCIGLVLNVSVMPMIDSKSDPESQQKQKVKSQNIHRNLIETIIDFFTVDPSGPQHSHIHHAVSASSH